MHFAGLLLFSLVTLFWVLHGLRVARGAMRLPHLGDCRPAQDEDCPLVSLLFAARDDEDKLPAALATLKNIDYPSQEVIAVNDRSTDATAAILSEAAQSDSRLKVVTVDALPAGWLGKPHALQRWLLFTDADVRFRQDSLRRP